MVLLRGLIALALLLGIWARPALAETDGANLFEAHCAGCHLNGGNIIRRDKTLKLKALERYGIHGPVDIAMIATEGRGQMSGYGDKLGEGGDQLVAGWILEQAQNAWIQG